MEKRLEQTKAEFQEPGGHIHYILLKMCGERIGILLEKRFCF